MHMDRDKGRIQKTKGLQEPRLCQGPAWFHSLSWGDPFYMGSCLLLLPVGFSHPSFIYLFYRLISCFFYWRSSMRPLTSHSAEALSNCFFAFRLLLFKISFCIAERKSIWLAQPDFPLATRMPRPAGHGLAVSQNSSSRSGKLISF